jgi:hypothetical protein
MNVHFESIPGEDIGVIGSITEMGCWKKVTKMKWTDGHIWVLE